MNKILLRLSAVMLCAGMLGASACSGCSPQTPPDAKSDPALAPQSMVCGAYTHRVGNQCVGDTTTSSSSRGTPSTLNTSGNN